MNTAAVSFEATVLREIASAVEHRRKAIRYHGELECGRTIEDSVERLNLDFIAIRGFRVRLSLWPDGMLWLGITKPGPRRTGGWTFYDEFHSQFGGLDAGDVIERFEQTIHSPTQARDLWPASDDGSEETKFAMNFVIRLL